MRPSKYLFIGIGLFCCMMLAAPIAYAQLKLANGYASGQWYNPARDGEGFYVEVIGEGEDLAIAVAMYSYDEAGNQLWLVGSAPIEPNTISREIPVILVEGPVWGTNYDPADQDTTQFGLIAVQFPTCDTALFIVNSDVAGLESGNYALVRLTEIVGMDCVEPPPPDGPPPEEHPEITPGLWTAEGVCFFVSDDGTQIVDSDQCDNGKSFSGLADGVEDPATLDPSCKAFVVCNGAWPINEKLDLALRPYKKAACVNADGGIAIIEFVEETLNDVTEVKGYVYMVEAAGLDAGGRVCKVGASQGIFARPAQ